MQSKPRRRWFPRSFGLRTMFVVVTIFGVWLGWNVKIVRERKAVLVEVQRLADEPIGGCFRKAEFNHYVTLEALADQSHHDYARVSRIRRLFGDESCVFLFLESMDKRWVERAERAFPEAELMMVVSESDTLTNAFRDSLYKPAHLREKNQGNIFKTGLIEGPQ